MLPLIYAFGAVLVGFIGLVWSADRFVDGSAAIARSLGMPPLIIGLTIVSLGTSAPEILVSINAALTGAGDLAIGNALGSNLANIGLVLGITTLVATLPIQRHILTQELPILLLVTVLAGVVLANYRLDFIEGLVLVGAIIPVIWLIIYFKRKSMSPVEVAETVNVVEEEKTPDMARSKAILWFLVGLILLVISSRVLVWGAIELASFWGVSPLIIGLTVVAIGTSLPELAASVMSAVRGHHDIALGNIVGSNIFNILAVMSVPALVSPLTVEPAVFTRDYMAMAGLTVLLAGMIGVAYWKNKRSAGIGKLTGTVLLLCYIGYCFLLFQASV